MKQMLTENILVIAGEESGDTLGAHTVRQWQKLNPALTFWGFGGRQMQEQGVEILHTTEELAVIGLTEAILNYHRLKGYAQELVAQVLLRKTKMVLLIDYPGFNLRLAKQLSQYNIPCHLLVSPQIWAWKFGRIHTIKKYIDSVLCLFQFETEIYAKENIESVFIGHPLVERVNNFKNQFHKEGNPLSSLVASKPEDTVLFLPGSRKNEIARHMGFLLQVAKKLHEKNPQLVFVVPAASEKAEQLLQDFSFPSYVQFIGKNSHAAMHYCQAAIACSGTATLECALFEIPFALIYKTSWLTYLVGKQVVTLPYIGMVNVLAKKFVIKEFIQTDMKVKDVSAELSRLLEDKKYFLSMKKSFQEVAKQLHANENVAFAAARWLEKKYQVLP